MSISIFDITFGIIFLSGGIFSFKKTLFYTIKGKEVEGIVKEVEDRILGAYCPTVEFNDEYNSGKTITMQLDYGSSKFNYDIGSKIKLIYYKDERKTKLFDKSWFDNYSGSVMCIVGGFLSIINGFTGYFSP